MDKFKDKQILVTGATGYVGTRLIPRLLAAGYRVKAMARSIAKLKARSWADHPNVEIIAADIFDKAKLLQALTNCSTAYYLIHSMNPQSKNFSESDRLAAENFCQAAEMVNLKQIIYLGGLGEESTDLSEHLRSRAEVGKILSNGKVPVTILRAAMIIGSGSASFEIMRYLVDRLPVMVTPKWVRTECQPISIRNVLEYLIACLGNEKTIGRIFDIGGPEILSYQNLMDIYAEESGLGRRLVIPVPYFTPKLSSYWIHLVTPLSASIARPLADGLRNPAICRENSIREIIPLHLLDCRSAIKLALERIKLENIESSWTDAGIIPADEWSLSGDPGWAGGTVYEDRRKIVVNAGANKLWHSLIRLGGKQGWYYGNWLWNLRGILDKLVGGVGLNRGRRDPNKVCPGDVLDFWRVFKVIPEKQLSLIAEMKLPGEATLEFFVRPIDENKTELEQVVHFRPVGLGGIVYWKLITPVHNVLFEGMLEGIAEASIIS